ETRGKVVVIGMNKGTVENASVLGKNEGVADGIVVGPLVVPLSRWCRKLIAEAHIQGEFGVHLPVVLNEPEIHSLPLIERGVRVLAVTRGEPQKHICNRSLKRPVLASEPSGVVELS